MFVLEISVFICELCGLVCEFNFGFFVVVVMEGVDIEIFLMEFYYNFLYDGYS